MSSNTDIYRSSQARNLAVIGAMVTGVVGVSMAVYSVIGGEEAGGAALLAASALAFGLLALSLDRTLRFVSGTSEVDRRGNQNGAYRAGDLVRRPPNERPPYRQPTAGRDHQDRRGPHYRSRA